MLTKQIAVEKMHNRSFKHSFHNYVFPAGQIPSLPSPDDKDETPLRVQKPLKTSCRYREVNEQTQIDRTTFPIEVRRGCYGTVGKGNISNLGISRKAT